MCEFLSFFVSVKKNQVVCGDPFSHSNCKVSSSDGDWREAEWTDRELEIRTTKDEDNSAYIATVTALAKTRAELCKILSPSKDMDGKQYWFNDKGLNRDGDLPAVINADGSQVWWKNGQRHRDGDLPAVICANGAQEWYKNGQRHRDGDQPAIIYADGSQAWYKNNQLHRDGDLPAVIHADGYQAWYKNGEYIRNNVRED